MIEAGELDLFDRVLKEATANHSGASLDEALARLGWHDALANDECAAVSLLFEHQGAANASSSALSQLLARSMGLDSPDRPLLLPPLGRRDAPAQLLGGRCHVRGIATSAHTARESLLVVAGDESQHVVLVLPAEPGTLTAQQVRGLDPELGLYEVTGTVSLPDDAEPTDVDWEPAVALGQRALGHELVGAARAMLELARQHAIDRVQFGRPIGAFQAVRHRLADSLVAIEATEALLAAAWAAPDATSSQIAKAFAGSSARTVARHCQQVLAGIGFTTEHPFHRYVRRTILLDQLLGAGNSLTRTLGTEILATRRLPPAVAL